MPDVMTIALMIVISSGTLAGLVAYLGREYWHLGCQQLTWALGLFGLSYLCMAWVSAPARQTVFFVAYVLFGCGLSACVWALHRFYRQPVPRARLLIVPLACAAAYVLLFEWVDWRTRTICTLLFANALWILQVLLGRRLQPRSKGEWLFMLGALLVASAMLLRMVYPEVSLSRLTTADGTRAIVLSFANLFVALHLMAVGFLLMARDQADAQLRRYASEDSLTGLANRRTALEALEHALQRHRPLEDHLSVLLIDVDHFKRINDMCGHPVGDRVLASMGGILRAKLRPHTVAGRYGGEEFIIICPATNTAEALQLAARLCDDVRSSITAQHQSEQWAVTISVGVGTWAPPEAANATAPCETLDSLLHKADQALYQAKHAGRDRVCLYAPALVLGEPQGLPA